MADIDVVRGRSLNWIWWVVGVVVVALLLMMLMRGGDRGANDRTPARTSQAASATVLAA